MYAYILHWRWCWWCYCDDLSPSSSSSHNTTTCFMVVRNLRRGPACGTAKRLRVTSMVCLVARVVAVCTSSPGLCLDGEPEQDITLQTPDASEIQHVKTKVRTGKAADRWSRDRSRSKAFVRVAQGNILIDCCCCCLPAERLAADAQAMPPRRSTTAAVPLYSVRAYRHHAAPNCFVYQMYVGYVRS